MSNENIYTHIKDVFINEDEVSDFVNLDNSIACYNKIVSALKKPLKLILFYGKPGSGKTFLLNKIASDLKEDKRLIFFPHPFFSETSFIEAISKEIYGSTLDNIDIVHEGLSQIEGLLQDSLEELIYGYDNLSGILKAHNIVSQILAKINTQATVFNDLLKKNTGQTINGLNGRLEEIINITNNVNTMVEDCFGSK